MEQRPTGMKYTNENANVNSSEEAVENFSADCSGFISGPVVEALRTGDEGAFRSVYLHTYDKLKRFLRYLLGSNEDAEEVVQDIFLYILENRDKIDSSKNFRSYLYTIARHMAGKQMARRKNVDKYIGYHTTLSPEFAWAPDEVVMSDELALVLTIYIDNMPPQRRRVFEMSRTEGKSIKEIAEALGISPNTVKSHLQSAIGGLRDMIGLFLLLFMQQ